MSVYYGIEDEVPFGIVASNVRRAGEFGSTTDEAYVRLFANGFSEVDDLLTGGVMGISNEQMYFGRLTEGSNIERIMTFDPVAGVPFRVNPAGSLPLGLPALEVSSNGGIGIRAHAPTAGDDFDIVIGQTGDTVSFGGADVTGIHDFTIDGTFTVTGQFVVDQTTTINTDQMQIINTGTGPALIVEQTGENDIMQVKDDGRTVMFIKDGGEVGFGTADPVATIHLHSICNEPMMIMESTSSSNVPIVFDREGHVGFGTAAPAARIHIREPEAALGGGEILRVSIGASNDSIVISEDGRLGIGTDPSSVPANRLLVVRGIIQAENLILGSGSGSGAGNLITAYGMTAPENVGPKLEFNDNSFCNVSTLEARRVLARDNGSVAVPSFSFSNFPETGLFTTSNGDLRTSIRGQDMIEVRQGALDIKGTLIATQLDAPIITNSLGVSINVSYNALSNVSTLYTDNLDSVDSLAPIDVRVPLKLDKITSDSVAIDMSYRTLSNVNAVSLTSITSETDRINVSDRMLSNVSELALSGTQRIVALDQAQAIDFGGSFLSNVRIPEVVTQTIRSDTGDTIDLTSMRLSNVATLSVANLESDTGVIESSATLSIAEITNLTGPAAGVVSITSTLATSTIKSLDDANSTIDFSANTLSNVHRLIVSEMAGTAAGLIDFVGSEVSNVSRLTVEYMTANSGTIDLEGTVLSNVGDIFAERIVASSISSVGGEIDFADAVLFVNSVSTNSATGDINFSYKNLSNVNTLQVTNILGDANSVITMAGQTVDTQTVILDEITSKNTAINVSGKDLSNVSKLYVSDITGTSSASGGAAVLNITTPLNVSKITSSDGALDLSSMELSNVSLLHVERIDATSGQVDFSGLVMSNVSEIIVNKIASDTGAVAIDSIVSGSVTDIINVNGSTFSNVRLIVNDITSSNGTLDLSASIVRVENVEGAGAGSAINFMGSTVSNVNTLVVGRIDNLPGSNAISMATIETASIIAPGAGQIDFKQSSLSNVNTFSVYTITNDIGTLDMSGLTLSNLGLIDGPVYTNTIMPKSGSNVTLNGYNLIGINDLSVDGNLRVRGEFFVMNTFSCNTDQFQIINDGTGPALVVDQQGAENIMQVMDDGNVVFYIQDGGQAAFGSFGTTIPSAGLGLVKGLVYVHNPISSNQAAVYIRQDNSNANALEIALGATEFVVTGEGLIGVGTNAPKVTFDAGQRKDAISIPSGATSERPGVPEVGYIRFNTTSSNFEGFGAGNTWGSLGGIKSTDQNTYITAEEYAGANDGNLRFFNAGAETMRLDSVGNLGIGTDAPKVSLDVGQRKDAISIPSGLTTERPEVPEVGYIRFNTTSSNFEGFGAGNTWGSLGGIKSTDQSTYITAEEYAGANDGNLRFFNAGVETMRLNSAGQLGIGTDSPAAGVLVDVAGNAKVQGTMIVDSIAGSDTGGAGGAIGFNYSRVLDIDSLIVRSNITVTLPGLETYTNLPQDLVRLDPDSGRILDSYISSNIVRLMTETQQINPLLIPQLQSTYSTRIGASKLGVGLINPQQTLHVHGNQCITGGRLGVGTIAPSAVLDIVDDNGPSPTMRVEQKGTTDILHIVGSNNVPLLHIAANNSIGIRTTAPIADYALDVRGWIHSDHGIKTNGIESITGTIDCHETIFSNVLDLRSTAVHTDTIAAASTGYITATSGIDVTGSVISGVGLRVADNVQAPAYLTTSDRRAKNVLGVSDPMVDLQTVLSIPVHHFTMKNATGTRTGTEAGAGADEIIGFLAQEVEAYAPQAIKTISGAVPSIMRFATSIAYGENASVAYIEDGAELRNGDLLRCVVGGTEHDLMVLDVTDNVITVEWNLSRKFVADQIFLYGTVTSDFKLLNSDRLLPIVFNAVKALYALIAK